MISLKNDFVFDVRQKEGASGVDVAVFENCLISAVGKYQRGEVESVNKGLLSEPEIDIAIPGLDKEFSKKGKPRTRTANLSNSIAVSLEWNVTAPCPCCGTKVSYRSNFTHFKQIAASVEAAKESIESLAEKCERHYIFGFVRWGVNGALVDTRSSFSRSGEAVASYCQPCLDEAKILVNQSHAAQIKEMNEGERVNTERLAEEKRLEEERIALRLKWEEENPKYLVLVGDLINIDKHNGAVNERLDSEYTIWGHPVNHDGKIAQTLIRKDFLEERARGGSGKNNRGSSYGRNGGNGGID